MPEQPNPNFETYNNHNIYNTDQQITIIIQNIKYMNDEWLRIYLPLGLGFQASLEVYLPFLCFFTLILSLWESWSSSNGVDLENHMLVLFPITILFVLWDLFDFDQDNICSDIYLNFKLKLIPQIIISHQEITKLD
jgi:hypothetical protein